MTISCRECDCDDTELVDSNGARDGKSTRVEFFKCDACGCRFSQVLRP